MNSEEKMLRLNNGKINTEVQYYPQNVYLDNILHQESYNPIKSPIPQVNTYKPLTKEYRSFNIYRDSDDSMSFYYIRKLQIEKETDITKYQKSVDYILNIMNSFDGNVANNGVAPNWVIAVYKWLQRNDY
jgi:hypothetical protein